MHGARPGRADALTEPSPHDLATTVLGAVQAAYAAESIETPSRAFVVTGELVWDAETLAVQILGVRQGQPSAQQVERSQLTVGRALDLAVHVVRCFPDLDEQGNPPSAAKIDDASKKISEEGWLTWRTLRTRLDDKSLFGTCRSGMLSPMTFVGPEGGYVSAVSSLAVQL